MKLINYIGETKMKDKKIGENHNKIDNSEKINGNYITFPCVIIKYCISL